MNNKVALDIRKISKRYGNKTALCDIELRVEAGEVVGLIGPNGAGKTTLIECAIGTKKPTSGCAKIMGLDTWTEHVPAARHYGVQFQTTELSPFTRVSDTFRFFQKAFAPKANPRELCAEFGINGSLYRSYFRKLSGGQKRRVLIALAFLGDPMVVLLDEPTAGMDPSVRSQFWDAVRRRRDAGRSVVCSSHNLEDMDTNCDRVAFLVDGNVRVSGSVVDIIRRYGAVLTYVIAVSEPQELLCILANQISGLDGIVWFGSVQGGVRIVTSKPFTEGTLTQLLNHGGVLHRFSRRSNLEDIYHVCMDTSETYWGNR